MTTDILESALYCFRQYKSLGEKAISQINDEALHWQYNEESNSIAVIVNHLHGNMMSRWTDFLSSDGEKEWRQRDSEFEQHALTREELMRRWEEGWSCLFTALTFLTSEELTSTVYIRAEAHSVIDAVHRQLSHYSYHIGQIVYIARMCTGPAWNPLSVPKGESQSFNSAMFAKRSV